MADLEQNFVQLQLMHESLARFSESFAGFLYGMNMNAFCVDFPEVRQGGKGRQRGTMANKGMCRRRYKSHSSDRKTIPTPKLRICAEVKELRIWRRPSSQPTHPSSTTRRAARCLPSFRLHIPRRRLRKRQVCREDEVAYHGLVDVEVSRPAAVHLGVQEAELALQEGLRDEDGEHDHNGRMLVASSILFGNDTQMSTWFLQS
jgi:hypothetical protein